MRGIGEALRDSPLAGVSDDALDGMASGVIGQVRAEDAQSWRTLFARGVADWHWAIVGGGSVGAAFVSLLFVTALLRFGPAPVREDSLAALLNNLGTPAGTLLMMATPVGPNQVPVLMQFDDGREPDDTPLGMLPTEFAESSEGDLVLELSAAMVAADGRMTDLRVMPAADRRRAETLLTALERVRTIPLATWSGRRVAIHRLGLLASTSVSAKAL